MIYLLASVQVPKSLVILAAVANAATELHLARVTVTSGNDATHMIGSKHYTDQALDFRTRDLTGPEARLLRATAQRRLGPAYQAILEVDHLHVEYDPPVPSHEVIA